MMMMVMMLKESKFNCDSFNSGFLSLLVFLLKRIASSCFSIPRTSYSSLRPGHQLVILKSSFKHVWERERIKSPLKIQQLLLKNRFIHKPLIISEIDKTMYNTFDSRKLSFQIRPNAVIANVCF